MAAERIIPVLPCLSIETIEQFYGVLGFRVLYRQTRPSPYLSIRWRTIDLHFFAVGFRPAESLAACLVVVPEPSELFAEFCAALTDHYGSVPNRGRPRLTRTHRGGLNSHRDDFSIVDPCGNWLRFTRAEPGHQVATPVSEEQVAEDGMLNPVAEPVPVMTGFAGSPSDLSPLGPSQRPPVIGTPPSGQWLRLGGLSEALAAAREAVQTGQDRAASAAALSTVLETSGKSAGSEDRIDAMEFLAQLALNDGQLDRAKDLLGQVDALAEHMPMSRRLGVLLARAYTLNRDLAKLVNQ